MSQVKHRITTNDPATGKRLIAELLVAPFGRFGYPLFVQYLVTVKETDEVTEATPPNQTDRGKRLVQAYEERFEINDRKIHSSTLLYLPDNTTNPNAITLAEYFRTHALNTFSGVNGDDQLDILARGILREVIQIKKANGELPI
jgi:hypothetical protein